MSDASSDVRYGEEKLMDPTDDGERFRWFATILFGAIAAGGAEIATNVDQDAVMSPRT